MSHLRTLSPRRTRVLRWCDRQVDTDLVAIWSPEDKQTLMGLVADGLAQALGSRYALTFDGRRALHEPHQEPSPEEPLPFPTEPQLDAMMAALTPDYPPSDPEE